jgi:hypothetical protein
MIPEFVCTFTKSLRKCAISKKPLISLRKNVPNTEGQEWDSESRSFGNDILYEAIPKEPLIIPEEA